MPLSNYFTPSSTWPRGCWPDKSQQLLLAACLLEDDDASLTAWQTWQDSIPLDFVDGTSARLLPLLHRRVSRIDSKAPGLKDLAGVVRYHWVHTQLMMRDASAILRLFNDAGIDTMLLKGAALNASIYPLGLRPMKDIDIVIRPEQTEKALSLLKDEGWEHEFPQPKKMRDLSHACHLTKTSNLDLHWNFFHGSILTNAQVNELWDASEPIQILGQTSRVLCPSDQLLHTCEHGMRYAPSPPFRWLADAHRIVTSLSESIDWDRCCRLGMEHGLLYPLLKTLQYLEQNFQVMLPENTWKKLTSYHIPMSNQLAHETLARRTPGQHPFWHDLPANLLSYRRLKKINPHLSLSEFLKVINSIDMPIRDLLMLLLKQNTVALKKQIEQKIEALDLYLSDEPTRTISMTTISQELVEGFHSRETHEGKTFRWSFPDATLRINLPVANYETTLHILPNRDCRNIDLNLKFNRSNLNWKAINANSVSFRIKKTMFVDYHQQRMTLQCAPWLLPDSDPRQLGLPLLQLKFRKLNDPLQN